jgi:hypothetical protein
MLSLWDRLPFDIQQLILTKKDELGADSKCKLAKCLSIEVLNINIHNHKNKPRNNFVVKLDIYHTFTRNKMTLETSIVSASSKNEFRSELLTGTGREWVASVIWELFDYFIHNEYNTTNTSLCFYINEKKLYKSAKTFEKRTKIRQEANQLRWMLGNNYFWNTLQNYYRERYKL